MDEPTPLDDVAFLARSPHRVAVVRRLQDGSCTRPDLHDETDISQPTLGRVLGSLQDRGWIEQTEREYRLSPSGGLVTEAFVDLLDTVETVQRLGDALGLLPTEQMAVDLARFGDATVTTPAAGNRFGHVRRVEELVYGADHLRLLSTTMPPGTAEEHADRASSFLEGEQVIESVITAETLDRTFADLPEAADWLESTVALDRVRLYRYDGPIPFMAGVADGNAFVVPMDGNGQPAAVIESTDERIRQWIEDLVDDYRSASVELTVDDLAR